MKNKNIILAAAIIVIILLTAGTLITAAEIVYYDKDDKANPAEGMQTVKTSNVIKTTDAASEENAIQSYSQEIPAAGHPGFQTPLIILLVGFTAIIAGVNHRLNKE